MSAEAQMSLAPRKPAGFPAAAPDSARILKAVRDSVLIAPYNDEPFIESLVTERTSEVEAVIVEPQQRIIPAAPGFLAFLRELCARHGITLIFDEIVTGFRFAYGGAQELFEVAPDIATLGKIIGGGFPLAAVAGRADIMSHFDRRRPGDEGFLMQVGTLSGNPVASVAGLKTIEILRRDGAYERLNANGRKLKDVFATQLGRADIPHQIVGHETLFDVVFTEGQARDYRDMLAADGEKSARFNRLLREHGIFKSPGKVYPSLALTDEDMEQTAVAIELAVKGFS